MSNHWETALLIIDIRDIQDYKEWRVAKSSSLVRHEYFTTSVDEIADNFRVNVASAIGTPYLVGSRSVHPTIRFQFTANMFKICSS